MCVAVGAIPAIATWYLRTKLPETPRFTVHVAKDTSKAEADVAAVLNNSDEFRKREKVLAATDSGLTWREFNNWVLTKKNFLVRVARDSAVTQQWLAVQPDLLHKAPALSGILTHLKSAHLNIAHIARQLLQHHECD